VRFQQTAAGLLTASHSSMAAISANKSANNLLEGIDGDYVPKNILITGKMTCTRSHWCCLLAKQPWLP
jgi:hypothetical protein